MAMSDMHCVFCLEPLNPGALKCKNCGEFVLPRKKPGGAALETYRITLDALAKIALPLCVLIALWCYRPTIETLLPRVEEMELLGQKVKFIKASVYASFVNNKLERLESSPSTESAHEVTRQIRLASQGLLDLHPLSLYYLIGAKSENVLHYEYVYVKDRKYIDALVPAGLATIETIEGKPGDPFGGKQGLKINLTAQGRAFLQALDVLPPVAASAPSK
jgi:hypothetical protein